MPNNNVSYYYCYLGVEYDMNLGLRKVWSSEGNSVNDNYNHVTRLKQTGWEHKQLSDASTWGQGCGIG